MAAAQVAVVQQTVMQYRRQFFELLRQRLAQDGVDLLLIHSNPTPEGDVWKDAVDLPWAHRVPAGAVRIGGSSLVWQRCHRLLRGADLVIVEQGSRHLLNYLLAAEQALGRRRLALWGHGRNFRARKVNRPAEWGKARLSRQAHWWFAYTELSAEVVAATGFPRERVTVVQNAIDARELARCVDSFADVAGIRAALGVGAGSVGLFVGKLHPAKRLDFLCRAADVMRAGASDFELVITGTGPHERVVSDFARTRRWVHVLGPRFGSDKAALLAIADVLLIPAWAGLVVLDAFAAEVPLVTSASQPHPPEFSYIIDGVNGVIVDDRGSHRRYAEAALALLDDPCRRAIIAAGCRAAREQYTVEEMVERFAGGIHEALRR